MKTNDKFKKKANWLKILFIFLTSVKWCGISHANIWKIFRGPFLNLVAKNRGLTFLNLICYLTMLLGNEDLCSLPWVYITLGRLLSVPVPLNLAYCFFVYKNYKAQWGNTCLQLKELQLSGIHCLWHLFSDLFLQDICQLIDYN